MGSEQPRGEIARGIEALEKETVRVVAASERLLEALGPVSRGAPKVEQGAVHGLRAHSTAGPVIKSVIESPLGVLLFATSERLAEITRRLEGSLEDLAL